MKAPGTVVVALGGNALAPQGEDRPTVADQFRHTRASLKPVVELARDGWRIALVHGNGPQVGDALARNELSAGEVEPLPLGMLVAETAGWIGYMIQQSLQNALEKAGVVRPVITMITQTIVNPDDPLLRAPNKPVGHTLSPARRDSLQARGVAMRADAKGNARRLAASPLPIGVVESDAVQRLVSSGAIVIAAGGGGPPVYSDLERGWEGVDAIVDKDRVAALLAHAVDADLLLILTGVDAVYRDFGTPRQQALARLTLEEARALLESGALGSGTMAPKVEAAVAFVEAGGSRAVIAALEDGAKAIRGEAGTTIAP